MPIPFRVRHAEWVAGIFVVLTAAAVLAALLVLTRVHCSFAAPPTYYVTVADGHGVAPGGPVKMLGIGIGTIEHVEITEDRRVRARLEIEPEYADRIGADSEARVEVSLGLEGMLAGVGFVVTPGSPEAAPLAPGSEIDAREVRSMAELLPLVSDDPMLAELALLVHNIRVLTDELNDPSSDLRRASASAAVVLARLEKGEGTVGRLLQDEGKLYERLIATMDEVDSTLAQTSKMMSRSGKLMQKSDDLVARADGLLDSSDAMVGTATRVFDKMDPVMDEADKAMKNLDAAVVSFAKTTKQLGELLVEMEAVVADMAQVAAATKKVWPIRRHVREQPKK